MWKNCFEAGNPTTGALGRALVLVAPALISACLAVPAVAQDAAVGDGAGSPSKLPKISKKKAASPNATINLVNLLVEKGILTEDQAKSLIKQAEDEAYVARESAKDATAKAGEATKAASAAAAAALPAGTKRVTYVPEIVKKQIREDLEQEVMAKAKAEGWASPGTYPEWASRIRFYGDFRARYQGNFFPPGNYPNFVNFNAINTGPPFDVTGFAFPPLFNTDEARNQFRIRARFGLDADLSNGFDAGVLIATGQDSSPVSENQTLGASGGNFSKYSIWLSRAYLRYRPLEDLAFSVGRFDNPFFSPIDLVWYKDLAFDGVAAQGAYELAPGFTPFGVAGAFPIFNTDFNFASNQPTKFKSTDKYLFGAQLGFRWKPDDDVKVTFGAAYYDFSDVQGRLSSPCLVLTASDLCSTDSLRPSFAQKGNTYMALRDIVPLPNGTLGPQFQYFGLASAFRDIVLTGQVDLAYFRPIHITLDGAFAKNLAFDRAAIEAVAVNNRSATPEATPTGILAPFAGGDTGYMARLTVGHPKLEQALDWNVSVAYKYLASDATVDAFTDPDFGLGGTNLKGFVIGANLGLSPNIWLAARWFSANAVAGPPLSADTVQVDLNAKF
jgi:hypothetical protein